MSHANTALPSSGDRSVKAEYGRKPLFMMGEQPVRIGDLITCSDDLFDYVIGELAQSPRYLQVEGYSVAVLARGVKAHRVYDAQGNMLQFLIDGQSTVACNWFALDGWFTPTSAAELERWKGPHGLIGDPAIEYENEAWHRVWVTGEEGWIPGVEIVEHVVIPVQGGERYEQHHVAMMYGNEVLPHKPQFLLLSCVSRSGQTDVQVHRGVEIDPGRIEVRRTLH